MQVTRFGFVVLLLSGQVVAIGNSSVTPPLGEEIIGMRLAESIAIPPLRSEVAAPASGTKKHELPNDSRDGNVRILPGIATVNSLVQWLGALAGLTETALRHYPAIQHSRQAVEAANAGVSSAKWQLAPTPSFSRDYAGDFYKDHYQNTVRIQQPLWTGGQITGGIDLAEAKSLAAKHSVNETEREIALKVASAWSEWVKALRRERELSRLALDHEDLLGMIGRRVRQGVAAQSDEDLARARLQNVRGELSRAQIAIRHAQTNLETLVGAPIDRSAERALLGNAPFSVRPSELMDAVLKSPSIERALAEEAAAEAELSVRKAVLSPQIFARGERLFGAIEDSRAYLGVQASFGAGFSTVSNIDAQKANVRAARSATETARKQAQDLANSEFSTYENASVAFDTAKRTLIDSEAVLESYRRQFVAGKRGWLDVLNMVREAHQARLEMITAEIDAQVAIYRIGVLSFVIPLAPGKL